MMSRLQRLIPLIIAAAIVFPYFLKGHGADNQLPVAFVRDAPEVYVKISGNIEKPGIYKVGALNLPETANQLTVLGGLESPPPQNFVLSNIENGSHLVILKNSQNRRTFTCSMMTARECVSLGIPLRMNALTVTDWEWLPGIGPKTAAAIIEYRQRIDGFTSIQELESVPGIGAGKISKLKTYFVGEY